MRQPETDELCRRCGKESETIQHITAACEQLEPTEYVKRHDGLTKIIHQKLAEAAELIEDKSPYYKCTPANVLESENFKLYWSRSIFKDKTIPFNRPDKQNKYQEMANEICSMWKQKAAQAVPIVISSTGVIPKSLSQSLTRLNLHPNTHTQLQKSVIRGTFSTVRNFLNYK